jgi:hypothetical protein
MIRVGLPTIVTGDLNIDLLKQQTSSRVNNGIILETVATNLDNYFVKWKVIL